MNESIRRGTFKGVLSLRIVNWATWLMSAEMKRFLAEGYPEDSTVEADSGRAEDDQAAFEGEPGDS